MKENPVPILNIWSGYSLLRSTWTISPGLSRLKELGYTQVGLSDFESLAGVEEFDQSARDLGLVPWIGMSRRFQIGTRESVVRLYARNGLGFKQLAQLTQNPSPVALEEIASEDLVLVVPAGIRDLAAFDRMNFAHLVVEVVQDQAGPVMLPSVRWFWIPGGALRYLKVGDQQAYQVLCKMGNGSPDPWAAPAVPYHEWLLSCPQMDPRRLYRPDFPGRVLPSSSFKLPHLVESPEQEFSLLEDKVREGCRQRYPNAGPEVLTRVRHELAIVRELGFAGYFLLVQDVVAHARAQGIRVGPGRGSAAGSMVAYLLGITELDPLRYGLLFERFLNPERKNMPDIDIDFDYERRMELIPYLRQRWGPDRVAQIGTYGTFGARAVLRDVGRALGYGPDIVQSLMQGIRWDGNFRLRDHHQEISQLLSSRNLKAEWLDIAERLEGLPRHRSIHAAGVVVSPVPLTEWIPCERDDEGHLVTQVEMATVERFGFLKLDLLGLRTLTVLDDIEKTEGLGEARISDVPPEDPKTLHLLARADTDGIFQLDGRGVKTLLREMEPRHLEEVMAVVALYRPGPMEAIRTYLNRRKNPSTIPDDAVSTICRDTYGVVVYQEQLMTVAVRLAGYTLAESDIFRRAISKKDHELLDREATRFQERLCQRGMKKTEARELWQSVLAFGDFGFNKSHAASYGLLSYYMAYLKAHHPLAFWKAELSSLIRQDKIEEALYQVVSQGFFVHPPDINRSQAVFTIESDHLLAGLAVINGIGLEAARWIVSNREKHGEFSSYRDFYQRVGTSIGSMGMESLKASGALSALGEFEDSVTSQMTFFEDRPENTREQPSTRDDRRVFGFAWPVAEGPIYVRMKPNEEEAAIIQSIKTVADIYPGNVPVVLARSRERGRQLKQIGILDHWQAIGQLKEIPGVIAAGRRVVGRTL